jgi:tRNA (cmo5U34)-methyltransferase
VSIEIPDNWTFKSDQVAAGFDAHVREQLPWYEWATSAVAHICRHYVAEGGMVYDLGASTGNIGSALADTINARGAQLVAIDNAQHMVDRYTGPGTCICADAARFDFQPFDVAVCFLFLMFLPVAGRRELLARLRSAAKPGACIVIVDKCEPIGGYVGSVLSRLALAEKLRAGVHPEQIVRKELALAGVQRPVTVAEVGVDAIEVFRFGDFAGWVIEP